MTRWAVIFHDDPKMLSIRADKSKRDAHVAYARTHPQLLIGGGLKPDLDQDFCGALWVVEADDRQAVVDLVCADPFYIAEYRQFEIYTWGKILDDQTVEL